MEQTAAADIATIGRISAVPAILQVIREMTGLRFAAVDQLDFGLYIASQIAQSHGGQLHVASTAQNGTLFTFSLPAAD